MQARALLERLRMRALRYEVRCSSGLQRTILPPPARSRSGERAVVDEPPRSKRTTIRAAPPPPSASGAAASMPEEMSEEEAVAPTVPAPPAILVEGSVAAESPSLVPPVSGERECASAGYTLPYLKKSL